MFDEAILLLSPLPHDNNQRRLAHITPATQLHETPRLKRSRRDASSMSDHSPHATADALVLKPINYEAGPYQLPSVMNDIRTALHETGHDFDVIDVVNLLTNNVNSAEEWFGAGAVIGFLQSAEPTEILLPISHLAPWNSPDVQSTSQLLQDNAKVRRNTPPSCGWFPLQAAPDSASRVLFLYKLQHRGMATIVVHTCRAPTQVSGQIEMHLPPHALEETGLEDDLEVIWAIITLGSKRPRSALHGVRISKPYIVRHPCLPNTLSWCFFVAGILKTSDFNGLSIPYPDDFPLGYDRRLGIRLAHRILELLEDNGDTSGSTLSCFFLAIRDELYVQHENPASSVPVPASNRKGQNKRSKAENPIKSKVKQGLKAPGAFIEAGDPTDTNTQQEVQALGEGFEIDNLTSSNTQQDAQAFSEVTDVDDSTESSSKPRLEGQCQPEQARYAGHGDLATMSKAKAVCIRKLFDVAGRFSKLREDIQAPFSLPNNT